ncbi:hypothetical protein [Sphingobacterium deserti]|uniref:Uncharacterized protein n=1 Tax=Sphingobacterium deserti TaxID=1229276 RepID=A0A0B8T3Y1_9SPHI|nr:hypothetical protein [Sphingobacterium deserti]KGE13963.1 hypothetical protein DI53_2157 [Sphingobacterium deserti]
MKKNLYVVTIIIVFIVAIMLIYLGLNERFGSVNKNEFYTASGVGAIIGAVTVIFINRRKNRAKARK